MRINMIKYKSHGKVMEHLLANDNKETAVSKLLKTKEIQNILQPIAKGG